MKIRNLFQLLGFKEKPRRYQYVMTDYEIADGLTLHYAQWSHPGESTKVMTRELMDGYRAYIREGDFCIDIGAHSGDTALPMAVAAGKSGCVLALEPNPYVFHVLEKNARANRLIANILPMQAAAAPQEGFMEFEYSDSGFCNGGRHEGISPFIHGHAYKLSVFAVNLEEELRSDFAERLPRLAFIKVDAEGYDLYVLRSLSAIIREHLPVIKAEVFKKAGDQYRSELLSFFAGLGYTVFKIKSEPAVRGDKLTAETLDPGKHYDVICVPNKAVNRTP